MKLTKEHEMLRIENITTTTLVTIVFVDPSRKTIELGCDDVVYITKPETILAIKQENII